MKSITIKGSQRESVGKVSSKALRNAGKVPCVLYGGEGPIHFSAEEKSFKKLVYTTEVFTVVIDFGKGKSYNAIVQDLQFHPVKENILHVDFYELHEDKEITMEIPVKLIGNSIGVLRGGVLRRNNRRLRVKALPENLPDFIEVDISKLRIGGKIYVSELETDNYIFMHNSNTVVCQVRTSRTVVEDDEEEEVETTEGDDKEMTQEAEKE